MSDDLIDLRIATETVTQEDQPSGTHPEDALPPDFEDDLDGMMDDLLFDEQGGEGHYNNERVSSPLPTHNSTTGTTGDNTMIMMMPRSPDSPDPWRLANAVHMELQENAKLPTFHWTVDRSGSAATAVTDATKVASHTNNGAVTTTTTTGTNDASHLTELFLSSERHLKYEYTNSHNSTTAANEGLGLPDALVKKQCDEDMNPTPLSEIKRRIARHEAKHHQALASSSLSSSNKHTAADSVWHAANGLPSTSLLRRSQRQESLPIPTVTTKSSDNNHPTAEAIAIDPSETNANDALMNQVDKLSGSVLSTLTKLVVATSTPMALSKHAVAHAVVKPVLQNASLQQSQYGFGRNHVVPSIPAASRHVKTASTPSRTTAVKPMSTTTVSTATGVTTQTVPGTGESPTNASSVLDESCRSINDDNEDSGGGGGRNNSVAYERKKQRAKTARIKLNEAIDQLQIAIGMAGTQSKQRVAQFEASTVPFRIISDCVATADSAKKWDRPSFVSSAASMIQGLNAQCEALLNALNEERSKKPTETVTIPVEALLASSSSGCSSPGNHTVSNSSSHSHCSGSGTKHALLESKDMMETSDESKKYTESCLKRKRLNGTHGSDQVTRSSPTYDNGLGLLWDLESSASTETYADKVVFTDRNIMDKIASFLEPLSIVRCIRVSKAWNKWGVFCSDRLWQNLAAARFGYFNVRQWQSRLEDAEAASAMVTASSRIYRAMDAGNVMPHLRLEGKLLLGESRLTGKVSAWAFLVERSNGETTRSVQRSPSMSGNGMYASIPVVQLWVVLQNTGIHGDDVVIREQELAVDASTRRRGNEMKEIGWDERFHKRILNLDGSPYVSRARRESASRHSVPELCRLRLFDSIIIETNIHADGCSTSSKFVQRSNFTQVLVQIRDGTTIPLVIPFPRDAMYLLP